MYAAKWMGVPPWELAEQDETWIEWAEMLSDIDAKRSKRGGKK